MRQRPFPFLFVLVALIFLASAGTSAAGGKAVTMPGTYENWNGDIDHLTIVQPFKAADYKRIVVTPVQTNDVNLPDESESTYQPVKDALAKSTENFVTGLRSKMQGKFVVEAGEIEGTAAGALVVRSRVAKMDPGSRTGRALGRSKLLHAMTDAAETRISGEIADAATGKILLRFTQQRRAGLGVLGGAYEELLRRTIRDIGGDVGRIIEAF